MFNVKFSWGFSHQHDVITEVMNKQENEKKDITLCNPSQMIFLASFARFVLIFAALVSFIFASL